MQSLSRPVSRGLRLLIAGTRQLIPRARISSKPAKEEMTAAEQTIGFIVLTASIMVPSSWMLAHLEDYKRKADPGKT